MCAKLEPEKEIIGEDNIYDYIIPDFNPTTAILFITDYMPRQLNKNNLLFFRYKVQQEYRWLLDRGYTDFIVDYGCNYGVLALLELIKHRENHEYNLYFGRVRYEHANYFTLLDTFRLMFQCIENGAQAIGSLTILDFIERVIKKVSTISCEKGLIKTDQKLPLFIYDYYKKKEQEYDG